RDREERRIDGAHRDARGGHLAALVVAGVAKRLSAHDRSAEAVARAEREHEQEGAQDHRSSVITRKRARRFCSRPASSSLASTGARSPCALVRSRSGSTPCSTSQSRIASARRSESASLYSSVPLPSACPSISSRRISGCSARWSRSACSEGRLQG